MQIGPRLPLSFGYPAASAQSRRERPDNDADERRRPPTATPGRPAERILQGELLDEAGGGAQDTVNPWQSVDPALRPAIAAYQAMLQVDAADGPRAGRRLDRYA